GRSDRRRPRGRPRAVRGRRLGRSRRHVRFCFFFQAEDGIRDYKVTGVQTCALPICSFSINVDGLAVVLIEKLLREGGWLLMDDRSEERRVGKECRSRWWRGH